ncbi:MAG: transcriptional repressor [Eubacteriales bacterium]
MQSCANAKDIKNTLIDYGIQASYTRIRIYEVLKSSKVHLSAEDVYLKLIDSIPTLSRTTVYNTLSLYAKKGVISEVPVYGKALKYDANNKAHGYFKCRICDGVFDIGANEMPSLKEGFKVEKIDVFYYGICSKCAQKLNEKKGSN